VLLSHLGSILTFAVAITAGVLSNFLTDWVRKGLDTRNVASRSNRKKKLQKEYLDAIFFAANKEYLAPHLIVRVGQIAATGVALAVIFLGFHALPPTIRDYWPTWMLFPYSVTFESLTAVVMTVWVVNLVFRLQRDTQLLLNRIMHLRLYLLSIPQEIRDFKLEASYRINV
jgi:hypothetical protein